jgi:MFS transporter, PAT family, beta-lactamase induction signal transducer AmpG
MRSGPWRWIGTLYFAEGLSATIVATVAGVLFKRLGLSNEAIALYVGGLVLPWSLKPLWSPLLEVFKTRRFFVVTTELLIAASLAGIALGLGSTSRATVCLVLLAFVAVCAATHDIAADGVFICSLSPESQARYLGWLSVVFHSGRLTAQGLLLALAGTFETRIGIVGAWRAVFAVFAGLSAALAFYHAWVLPGGEPERSPTSVGEVVATSRDVVTSFFKRPHIAGLLAFVVLYRAAEGQLLRMAPLFLIDREAQGGLGLSTSELGIFYGGLGASACMAGALIGGWISVRVGVRAALVGLCAAFNFPAVVYVLLAWWRPRSVAVVGAAIVFEQLVYGIGIIGLKLVMMQAVAQGRYQTAHFAFASSLSGLGAAAAGMFSGWLQASLGYRGFFVWTVIAAIPVLFVAYLSSRPAPEREESPCLSAA